MSDSTVTEESFIEFLDSTASLRFGEDRCFGEYYGYVTGLPWNIDGDQRRKTDAFKLWLKKYYLDLVPGANPYFIPFAKILVDWAKTKGLKYTIFGDALGEGFGFKLDS